jgi:hypothetical protein
MSIKIERRRNETNSELTNRFFNKYPTKRIKLEWILNHTVLDKAKKIQLERQLKIYDNPR